MTPFTRLVAAALLSAATAAHAGPGKPPNFDDTTYPDDQDVHAVATTRPGFDKPANFDDATYPDNEEALLIGPSGVVAGPGLPAGQDDAFYPEPVPRDDRALSSAPESRPTDSRVGSGSP